MKINLIGQIIGVSGYVSHTRNLFNALVEQGADVKLTVPLPQGWEQQVTDAELTAINKTDDEDRVVIFIGLPNQWYTWLIKRPKKFYSYCIWEGDKIPSQWIDIFLDERVTGILVPSKHTKQAIMNTFYNKVDKEYYKNNVPQHPKILTERFKENDKMIGKIIDKIHTIPHGVDHSLFFQEDNKLKDKEKLTFLCNSGWRGGWNDRKGVPYLLKAYLDEFTKEDKVKLFIKINPAYCSQGWNFEQECLKLGIKKEEGQPEVVVNTFPLDYKVMRNIYNMADVFVSTTMADAWNLGGTEAMACGLPTAQCSFGGQMMYLNKDNGWIIEGGNLEHVSDEILYEQTKWLRPDVKEIRKTLRYIYEHQDEVKTKGKQALADSKQWSWRNSALKIMEVIST